jgi:imidazolonepropionase-like amidohydrolase
MKRLLVASAAFAALMAHPALATEALVGATLIDGTGRAPVPDAVVVIDGDRVVAAGPRAKVRIPDDATVRDVAGKWVIPGLMDANVHLFFQIMPDSLMRYEGHYEDVIAEAAQVALKNGLTTVFDTWGPREALVNVRDRINSGQVVGSRMYVAGNIIGLGGPNSTDFFPASRQVFSGRIADEIDARWEQGVGADLLWLTPDEVRAKVATYADTTKVDFLKYAASGHAQMQFLTFSPETQKAIVEEGHKRGMTVQAHTSSPESLRQEIEAGADLLQHCDVTGMKPIPASTLAVMAKRKIPCAALLITQKNMTWQRDNLPYPMGSFAPVRDQNARAMIGAGVPLLLTTDAGVYGLEETHPMYKALVAAPDNLTVLGEGHFLWLQAAKELGMSPMEGLLSATKNIAVAYKRPDLGTLEAGKKADLLVLDADPLADPKNYRRISLILKDGKVVDRDALPNPKVTSK